MAFTYCTNCGSKIDDSEKACPNCGQRNEAFDVGATSGNNGRNTYGNQGNPYGNQGNPYGNQGNPYGNQGNPYGNQGNPYGNQGNPYGNQGNPYGNQGNPYGNQGNPYGNQGNPYGNQGDPYNGQQPWRTPYPPNYGYGAPYGKRRRISIGLMLLSIFTVFQSPIFGFLALYHTLVAVQQPTDEAEKKKKKLAIIFSIIGIVINVTLTVLLCTVWREEYIAYIEYIEQYYQNIP